MYVCISISIYLSVLLHSYLASSSTRAQWGRTIHIVNIDIDKDIDMYTYMYVCISISIFHSVSATFLPSTVFYSCPVGMDHIYRRYRYRYIYIDTHISISIRTCMYVSLSLSITLFLLHSYLASSCTRAQWGRTIHIVNIDIDIDIYIYTYMYVCISISIYHCFCYILTWRRLLLVPSGVGPYIL